MNFLWGYAIGRTIASDRSYRQVPSGGTFPCYGGAVLAGLGLLAAMNDRTWGWVLLVLGLAFAVAGMCMRRKPSHAPYEKPASAIIAALLTALCLAGLVCFLVFTE